MRSALLLAWLFPPHGSIGAKRPWRFARHLPSHGWRPVVLTGSEPPARLRDPTPALLPPEAEVLRCYDPPWLARLASRLDARAHARPAALRTGPAPPPSALARAQSWLLASLPTETIAVHAPHAFAQGLAAARRFDCEVLWSTSYPYSAHLVGYALKRATGLPWVCDLRDPWTLNFVHDRKPALSRALERSLERLVFAHADAVTVTTEALRDAYLAREPSLRGRIHTIRNGFDRVPLPPRERAPAELRLAHFGHVYGARTLEPFLRALAECVRREPALRARFCLENLGRVSEGDVALARELGVEDLLRLREPLPYLEGLRSLRGASALLLPAWGTERGALMLPGKLYDYLLVGAPVLAAGYNEELGTILAETGAGVLHPPEDHAALVESLLAVSRGEGPRGASESAAAPYDAASRTRELAALFDALAQG